MKKSPVTVVKERFESKAKLVEAVQKLATADLWVERLNADKGLAKVSNEKLIKLHDVLVARLEPMGRLGWALGECEERRLRVRTRPEPELAWWRMKGARQLRSFSDC